MQNLTAIDWNEVVQRLEQFSTCETARQILEETAPLKSTSECKNSFSIINQAAAILSSGPRPFFESLDLFQTWHQRLKRSAILKSIELKDVRSFCRECLAFGDVIFNFNSPWAESLKVDLMDSELTLERIDQIITADGDIRSDASPTLKSLFKEKTQLAVTIRSSLDRIVKDHQLETVLQDRYVTNREGRWVLPVKSGMRHQFEGLIHAASQSRQTVFMEPKEIIPSNNRLRQIDIEIEDEIEQLLTELSIYLHSQTESFEISQVKMLEADIRFSQARLHMQLKSSSCQFSDQGFELVDLRHPLLVLNNEAVVPNTVELNTNKKLLLLSGPNAGGKTVLLKSIGLAAHMARCGLPICAGEKSSLPFVKHMHIGVGDHQNVGEAMSTFAAHVKVLSEASEARSPRDLILIDEICGSTDPEEGAALARAFVETYSESGAFSIITSHLGALKKGWDDNSSVINGSLEFSPHTGPTYQFILGVPGQSLAIQTAERVGVSKSIIEKAVQHMSPESKQYQQTLKEIEHFKNEVAKLRSDLLEEKKSFNKKKSKYEVLIQKFEKERQGLLDQSVKKAERKVTTLIKHAKVDDIFNRHTNLQKIKSDLPKVIKDNENSGKGALSADEFIAAYPPGTKVYVETIGKDGVIQGLPNGKGDIPILSGSMRITVPWSALKPPIHMENRTKQILQNRRITHRHFDSPTLDRDRIIDVRGLKVDEALKKVEFDLDQATLNGEDRVKVIHGHGSSDRLKRAVRSYLSRSLYVKKWQAGRKENGGDGVTWLEIEDTRS